MSSFNATDYFGSGPHTFASGPLGKQVERKLDLGMLDAGLEVLGDYMATVTVSGRLVAASAAALRTLTGALEGAAGVKGDLIDDTDRTWESLTLAEIRYDGPPQAGREWSIGYRVLFVEM